MRVFVYYDRLKKASDDNQASEEQTNELARLLKLFQHIVTHKEIPGSTRLPMSMVNDQANWFERNGAFTYKDHDNKPIEPTNIIPDVAPTMQIQL